MPDVTYEEVKRIRDEAASWLEAALALAGTAGVGKFIYDRLIKNCRTVEANSTVVLEDLARPGVTPQTVVKDVSDLPAVTEMMTAYAEAAAERELVEIA